MTKIIIVIVIVAVVVLGGFFLWKGTRPAPLPTPPSAQTPIPPQAPQPEELIITPEPGGEPSPEPKKEAEKIPSPQPPPSQAQPVPQPPPPTPQPSPPPPTSPLPQEPVQETVSHTVEADDSGLYPATITVPAGAQVNLTFKVRSQNVYFGGLDFRSSKFSTERVPPGGETTVTFVTTESFSYSSYWPSSGVKKADGMVLVGS